MKHSAKVMSLAMALSVTTAMVPQGSAQTQPPNAGAPQGATPAQQQTQTQQQQTTHPKAKGEAAGAAVGTMTTGNAAKGAVVGAGHSRRQEGRTNRQGQ
jgi:hypothetical protein